MKLYDVGCFNGDSPLHFISYPEVDQIEAFDPNPRFESLWSDISKFYPQIRFHNKAVSNKNGTVTYTLRPEDRPLGSTTNQDKADWGMGDILEVESIDIADIINEPCWLKLDAEGGEFDILERLIETDKLKLVKRIFIEWHTGKLKGDYESRYKKIDKALHDSGMEIRNW